MTPNHPFDTSAYYDVLEQVPEISQCLVVHLGDPRTTTGRCILLVVAADASQPQTTASRAAARAIWTELSPQHMPDRIVVAPSLPRSYGTDRSGAEAFVKHILEGGDPLEAPDDMSDDLLNRAFFRGVGAAIGFEVDMFGMPVWAPLRNLGNGVSVRREGGLAMIMVDQSAERTLHLATLSSVAEAIEDADDDPDVTVIALAGSHGAFRADSDVLERRALRDATESPVERFVQAVLTSSTVLVVSIEGPVLRVGETPLLHRDLVYGRRRSYVQFGPRVGAGWRATHAAI